MNKRYNFIWRLLFAPLILNLTDDAGGGGGGDAGGGDARAGGKGGDASLLGGKGGGGNDWRATLPEDIRADPAFSTVKAKDANEALGVISKMYVGAQKLIGVDKIAKPNDKWTPEQWKNFHKEMGVPEKPDDYKLPEVKLAEGLSLVDEKVGNFKKLFHNLGLTPKQVEGVMKGYLEDVNNDYTAGLQRTQQGMKQAEQTLRDEFGDNYDAKLDVARSVLKKFGNDEILGKLEAAGLANDPDVVKMFVALGEGMLEDHAGGAGDGLQVSAPTQALQEINRLKTDTEFMGALNNRNNPGHKEAVERWLKLHQSAATRKE